MACITSQSTDAPRGSTENPFPMLQGKRFAFTTKVLKANGSPFPLTGFTGRAQMRKQTSDLGAPIATFVVTNDPVITNKALVELGATTTQTILIGRYVFDVEFEEDIDPENVIDGSNGVQHIEVIGEVTK